jgi:hypothetical protein
MEMTMSIPMNIHDWHTLLMLGSLALLAIGVVLKVAHKTAPIAEAEFDEGIGRYRPRVYH